VKQLSEKIKSTTRHQEGGGWVPIIRFNTATFFCLSETKTWFSNVTWRNIFLCSVTWGERWLFVLLILVGLLTITA